MKKTPMNQILNILCRYNNILPRELLYVIASYNQDFDVRLIQVGDEIQCHRFHTFWFRTIVMSLPKYANESEIKRPHIPVMYYGCKVRDANILENCSNSTFDKKYALYWTLDDFKEHISHGSILFRDGYGPTFFTFTVALPTLESFDLTKKLIKSKKYHPQKNTIMRVN